MAKNVVSILLVAIFFLCNIAFAERAIVLRDDEGIILDGNGVEVIVPGKLTTVQNDSKIDLIDDHYRCGWHF